MHCMSTTFPMRTNFYKLPEGFEAEIEKEKACQPKSPSQKLAGNRRAHALPEAHDRFRPQDSCSRETGAKCQQHTPRSTCMTRRAPLAGARNSSDTDSKGSERRITDLESGFSRIGAAPSGDRSAQTAASWCWCSSRAPTDRPLRTHSTHPPPPAARTDGVSVQRPPLGLCLLVTRPRGGRGGAGADRWGRATPPQTPNRGTVARAAAPFALVCAPPSHGTERILKRNQ